MAMKNVAIYGTGLIGGSIGLKIKQNKLPYRVLGFGGHKKNLKLALQRKAVDEIFFEDNNVLKKADFIILTVPPKIVSAFINKSLKHFKKNTLITDATSVRDNIDIGVYKLLNKHNKLTGRNISFIGSHPMAGSEKKGIKYADAAIFQNANVFITPYKIVNKKNLKFLKDFWNMLGCKIQVIDPLNHDKFVGFTSHLPHLLSGLLINLIFKEYSKNKSIKNAIANSFRDMTRISDSNPSLWADICELNEKNLIKSLSKLRSDIEKIEINLKNKKFDNIFKFFELANQNRKTLVK
ncbi:prephenate dehydrogenase [bacterium]